VVSDTLELIVNPASGRGTTRSLLPEVEAELSRQGVPYHLSVSRSPSDPGPLAHEAAADGRVVVAMGGDGLIGLVADTLAGTGAVMGIIATGVGNDFARALGLPVKNPPEAVRVLCEGSPRRVDLGSVTWSGGSRHFCCVAGAGFDSEATRWANSVTWLSGRPLYALATLRTLATFSPRRFSISCDAEPPIQYTAWLVAVANSPSYGGGMKIAPRAHLDDGHLDVTVVGPVGRVEFLRTFPRVYKGTHLSHPRIDALVAKSVHIESDDPMVCYADGERCGPLPIDATAVPGALQVLVPPRASGADGT
jgi:diacylglycerol kinase (ATP)